MNTKIIAVALLGVLLNGCGGGKLSAAGGQATAAQVKAIFAAQGVSTMLGTLKPQSTATNPISISVGFAENTLDVCKTKNPTTTEDRDGDSIPASLSVKYDCHEIESQGSKITRVGTLKLVDYNDEPGDANKGWGGGYRYDYDFSNRYVVAHEDFTDIYKGFFEVKNTSSSIIYSTEYTGAVVGKQTNNGKTFGWNWKWQSQWMNTYTPDDLTKPYEKGSASFDGFFGASGLIEPDNNGKQEEVSVVFALKSKNLTYDRVGCGTFWKGSIIYIDGAKNEYRYDYDCTNTKVYYNNELL